MEIDREYLVLIIRELCKVLGIKEREVVPAKNGSSRKGRMVLSVADFADATGIPTTTVYGMLKAGAIRNVAPEGQRRCLIPVSELEKFR